MILKEKINQLLKLETEAINNIPVNESYSKCIDMIYDAVHSKGRKIVFSGMGKAGQVGINIATTMSSTGTPSVYIHAAEAQHGDLGMMQKGDLLFLISNSGKTREVVELKDLALRLHPDTKIIVLTSNNDSELAKGADCVLLTGYPKEICPLGLTPTTSTTTMMVIGDILVVLLMEKIGFTREQYSLRHHGGYLGTQAKK